LIKAREGLGLQTSKWRHQRRGRRTKGRKGKWKGKVKGEGGGKKEGKKTWVLVVTSEEETKEMLRCTLDRGTERCLITIMAIDKRRSQRVVKEVEKDR